MPGRAPCSVRAGMSAAGIDSRRAWGVVGAAFAAMFAAFGIAYSYGAFLEELRADFGAGRALASVFFSLTSLLYFGLGSVSAAPRRPLGTAARAARGRGRVRDRAGGRPPGRARCPSRSTAYGLGVGIGVACAYVPMVALVGGWFEQRRTLALGVAVAGIGLGTLTVPPATAALIEASGLAHAYLVHGLAGAAVLAVCALLVAPGAARARGLRHARCGRRRATAATAGCTSRPCSSRWRCSCRSCTCPPTRRSGASDPVAAAGLIGAIGVASVVGRLALGALAGGSGLLRVFQGCYAAMGLSFALWAVAGGSYAVDARVRRGARRRLRRLRRARPGRGGRALRRRQPRCAARRALHRAGPRLGGRPAARGRGDRRGGLRTRDRGLAAWSAWPRSPPSCRCGSCASAVLMHARSQADTVPAR